MKKVTLLNMETRQWSNVIRAQLEAEGLGEGSALPFYENNVPGEKIDPSKPKPPLLMAVTQPTEEFIQEHGPYGRFDHRSSQANQETMAKLGIKTLEQEDGLPNNNGVFHTEMFSMTSHFGLAAPATAATLMVEREFEITSRFTVATENASEEQAKLTEIATTIKNSADRAGIDVEHISSKQWAAIFRWSNALIIGSVKLPDFQINVIAGSMRTYFTAEKIEPLPLIHSIAAQMNTRPVMEQVYGEPSAVWLEVLER